MRTLISLLTLALVAGCCGEADAQSSMASTSYEVHEVQLRRGQQRRMERRQRRAARGSSHGSTANATVESYGSSGSVSYQTTTTTVTETTESSAPVAAHSAPVYVPARSGLLMRRPAVIIPRRRMMCSGGVCKMQ